MKNVNADKVDEASDDSQVYFQDLPTDNTDINDNEQVGHRLAYCLENIVKKKSKYQL